MRPHLGPLPEGEEGRKPAAKEQSMSDILRLGMAGLGVASTQIMPPIAKLPFIKITAAADPGLRSDLNFPALCEGGACTREVCRLDWRC